MRASAWHSARDLLASLVGSIRANTAYRETLHWVEMARSHTLMGRRLAGKTKALIQMPESGHFGVGFRGSTHIPKLSKNQYVCIFLGPVAFP